MKHTVLTKKGILSAVLVVAIGFVLAGGSASADKAHAEMIAQEKAIAAAKAEREAKLAFSKFEPVTEFSGYETRDIGDNVPGIFVKEDATNFNQQIQAEIEAEEARLAAEAEAKAKEEQKAKEEAERKQREEQARQEAASQNNNTNTNNSTNDNAGTTDSANGSSSESTSDTADDANKEESNDSSSDSSSSSGSRDVSVLYKYVGSPYVWGGTSPSGWDCSGFVQYVMKNEFGVSVGRTAASQAGNGYGISVSDRSQWQPGDLLIYRAGNGNIGHVAIYLGGGQMIHALNEKHDTFVQSVSAYDSWDSNTLVKVRRVLN